MMLPWDSVITGLSEAVNGVIWNISQTQVNSVANIYIILLYGRHQLEEFLNTIVSEDKTLWTVPIRCLFNSYGFDNAS